MHFITMVFFQFDPLLNNLSFSSYRSLFVAVILGAAIACVGCSQSTHPTDQERIDAMEQVIKQMSPTDAHLTVERNQGVSQ